MKKAVIHFADETTIEVREHDAITGVSACSDDKGKFSSMSKSAELQIHIHDGLIPSIMDVLCFCPFFYIGEDHDVIYGTNSIVKIENI